VPDYQLAPSAPFDASLDRLVRRYPHARTDIQPCLESLKKRPEKGNAIPGWGNRVWKLRINSTDIRRGKRYGFRLIYHLDGSTIYPLLVYAKARKSDVSKQEIRDALREIGRSP
jgi:mRNA-degrading endonuclease RelE of RelBE toxin-antitoxin system